MKEEPILMKQILIEIRDIILLFVIILLMVWITLTGISDWQGAQQDRRAGVITSPK